MSEPLRVESPAGGERGPSGPARSAESGQGVRYTETEERNLGVVRQQTFSAKTYGGQDYRNVYCFVFRFDADGKIAYLTEHWNTWHAYNVLFNNFAMEPAHPRAEGA